MKLSYFVKTLRNTLDLTQEELARKLKMQQETVSCWETGKRGLSWRTARKLIKFCRENDIYINIEELQ